MSAVKVGDLVHAGHSHGDPPEPCRVVFVGTVPEHREPVAIVANLDPEGHEVEGWTATFPLRLVRRIEVDR